MHSDVAQYQWFWHNLTNESMYYKYQGLAVDQTTLHLDKNNFLLPKKKKKHPKHQLTLAVLDCLPRDPPLVAVIHVNEGEEQQRRTEQKFVNKHLLRRGLLSLEINGVLNKPLPLEQCQCQREFAVKEKLHTCPGKLPSHYFMYLTWMRSCVAGKCAVIRGLLVISRTNWVCVENNRVLLWNAPLLMQWNNNLTHHLYSFLFFSFCITHCASVCCLWTFHQLRQSIQPMSQ